METTIWFCTLRNIVVCHQALLMESAICILGIRLVSVPEHRQHARELQRARAGFGTHDLSRVGGWDTGSEDS